LVRNEIEDKSMTMTEAVAMATAGAMAIRPLSPAIGVEVVGVDLSAPLDDARFAAIRRAWEENCVVLFRGQALTDQQQLAFASRFGTPATVNRDGGVLYISNIRENGQLIGSLPDGEMHFHSDQCYVERPAMATMLYAMEIPSKGGNTLFANGFRAYDTLPDTLKAKLTGKRALNAFDHNGSYGGSTTLRSTNMRPGVKQYAHPVFRTHPAVGRKSLYVNRLMTQDIIGLPDEESDAILNFLFEHIERPEFVYEHVWTVGDLILWDNRSCCHARTDFSAAERRKLRRVTVQGEVPYET
jgi:taurine dioxygenase